MTPLTKQAYGPYDLLQDIQNLPPRNVLAASLIGLGGAGLLYQALRGKPPGAKSVMIPRQIRVALPRFDNEEDLSDEGLGKQSGAWSKIKGWLDSPGILGGFALGAATPIGLYGLVRGYQQLSEERHANQMREKALRLQALTDYGRSDQEVLGKNYQPQESEQVVEKLASLEFEKRSGYFDWIPSWAQTEAGISNVGSMVYGLPFALGALSGTGGLAAYLATRKQLLPEDAVDDREDTSLPQLLVDDEEGGYGLPGSPTYEV